MNPSKRISAVPLIPMVTAFLCLLLLACELVAQEVAQESLATKGGTEVSFAADVWPILQNRCSQCHCAQRTEGDLRFDAGRAAAQEGGHTGRSVLGSSATESELIRRITSLEAGYRMPKKGAPLLASEIATLTQWIDDGAPWDETATRPSPADKSSSVDETDEATSLADRVVWFESQMMNTGFRRLVYLSIIFCVTMVAAFFVLRRSQSNSLWLSRVKTVVILLLVFLCAATYIYYDSKHKDSLADMAKVNQQLLTYTGPPELSHSLDAPHPMHPPRLGGVYYRGNDERDPTLFNGGFYRTAQLEVWLSDRDGNHLQWGDVAAGELFIDFVIKRAPNTTGELFSDHVMAVVGLTDDAQISNDADYRTTIGDVLPMETIEPDQMWRCRFPVGSLKKQKKTNGKLFVVQNTFKAKAHYAIEFEIEVGSSGAITEDSQVWMGSLYNLNGRVFVPYNDHKIMLDRWFDFRPIPEIQGPQTVDPALLGIPEHQ